MGCSNSAEQKPQCNVTADQVRLVKESWAKVNAKFPDLEVVGKVFYDIEFEHNPELKYTLFHGVNMDKQAHKLMVMVDSAVAALDDIAKLATVLEDLGKRHGGYGVEAQHYPIIGAHLISTLRVGLAEEFTAEVEGAWGAVYGFIQERMMKGADTPDGKRLLKEFKDKEAAENVKAVKASWATVKGAFKLQAVGDLFYATLFEQNPEYTKTLFKGVDHKKQAKKLIEMIDAAVGILDDLDKLVPILKDLGERHGAYGVEDKDYAPVGAALIATLKKGLGEKLTGKDEYAWVWVYGVIETTMQEGAKSEKGQRLLAEYKEKKAAEQKKTFEAVQASWATVKGAFKLQAVGDLFYATLFEQNPEYTQTLFKGVDHKKQAKKLIEMIDAAVGMLSEVEKLVPILEDLGERHGAYGVEDKDYAPVGAALIATLKKGLAKKLTKTDEAAWVEVYGIIETTMQKGAKTEKGQRLLAEYKEKKAAEAAKKPAAKKVAAKKAAPKK